MILTSYCHYLWFLILLSVSITIITTTDIDSNPLKKCIIFDPFDKPTGIPISMLVNDNTDFFCQETSNAVPYISSSWESRVICLSEPVKAYVELTKFQSKKGFAYQSYNDPPTFAKFQYKISDSSHFRRFFHSNIYFSASISELIGEDFDLSLSFLKKMGNEIITRCESPMTKVETIQHGVAYEFKNWAKWLGDQNSLCNGLEETNAIEITVKQNYFGGDGFFTDFTFCLESVPDTKNAIWGESENNNFSRKISKNNLKEAISWQKVKK